jgi:hypothetical protein
MNERHEHVARLLGDLGPPAPPALRARIEAERRRAAESRAPLFAGARLAFAGAVGALALAAAVVVPTFFEGEQIQALDVHALGSRGTEAPAPEPQAGGKSLLAEDVEGVTFPDWDRKFGWRAVGYRADTLADRQTETVFYHHEGHTIAYTIVSGTPLDSPDGAVSRRAGGMDLAELTDDHGHDIVVFERGGHTCVLSGHVEHRDTLAELASWRSGGGART